jgi:hypothetical protein
MKIVLPRASRGAVYPRLFPIELNTFDAERVLPSLFYLVIARGHGRAHRPNDAKQVERYLDSLVAHPKLTGFGGVEGRRLLDLWLRTDIVRMARVGRARTTEKIDYVVPHTVLVHKTGLPDAGQRNVHTFLYNSMLDAFRGVVGSVPKDRVYQIVTNALGQGVEIDPGPAFDGRYDEKTEVDITTLLSLRYLDGYGPTRAAQRTDDQSIGAALPAYADRQGRELLSFMQAYAHVLPANALVRGVMALLSAGLFTYSAKLAYATNEFIRLGTKSPAMMSNADCTPPEIYCDFIQEPKKLSDEIARSCVDRDLEELGRFYDSLMTLRTLDRFADMAPEARPLLEAHQGDTPSYLEALWSLRDAPGIVARGHAEVESISAATFEAGIDDDVVSALNQYRQDLSHAYQNNHFLVAAHLTSEAQRKAVVSNMVKWFWSSGGLRVPYGLLKGNVRGARNWRYQISDDLLAAFVQLAFVEGAHGPDVNPSLRTRVKLANFLTYLESRFGLIIDRPPGFLENTESRAIAHWNLEAMKRRLRQMGYFRQLSDDFNAQYLTLPLQQAHE